MAYDPLEDDADTANASESGQNASAPDILDVEAEGVEQVPLPPTPGERLSELLGRHDGALAIAIERLEPTWARGHLTTYRLEAGEQIDLDRIKAEFGGGRYRFRPQVNGRWVRGSEIVAIAGQPLESGLPLLPGGQIGSIGVGGTGTPYRPNPGPSSNVVSLSRGGQAGPMDVLAQLCQGLIDRLDKLEARQAQSQAAVPAGNADQLSQLSDTVSALTKFKQLLGDVDLPEPEPEPERDDNDMLPMMLMMGGMGGGNGQQGMNPMLMYMMMKGKGSSGGGDMKDLMAFMSQMQQQQPQQQQQQPHYYYPPAPQQVQGYPPQQQPYQQAPPPQQPPNQMANQWAQFQEWMQAREQPKPPQPEPPVQQEQPVQQPPKKDVWADDDDDTGNGDPYA